VNPVVNIQDEFDQLSDKVNEYQTRHQALNEDIDDLHDKRDTIESEIEKLQDKKKHITKANEVIKQLIETVFNQKIEEYKQLINRGLQSIFEDRYYEFDVDVDDYGSSKKAKLLYRENKDGDWTEWRNIDNGSGAVRTVTDMVTRIYLIKILGKRKLLFLDESLNAVAGQYRNNVVEFLNELAESMGFDILIVSHNDDIVEKIDNVYEVDNGHVTKVKNQ
jgi:DNA repair exonuclease SbcCD ATPase subunit